MPRVYTVILGGGRGQRLYPLTKHRAKPAVPVGGKYRLIDIPLSNAINSGFRHIAVLTQFNSASLNSHITNTYRFDIFGQGQVEVLAAEQTDEGGDWYQGTADAVRKQIRRLTAWGVEHLVILSGDHLYRMNYREMFDRHISTGADATVSVIPVDRAHVTGLGVVSCDEKGLVTGFREKPRPEEDITNLLCPPALRDTWGLREGDYLASMGVYIFRLSALREMLQSPSYMDFGKDILPDMLRSHKVAGFLFGGYWRDIGTVGALYEAQLDLTEEEPPFRFHHADGPIYTRQRFLPASKLIDARVSRSILSDGCLLFGSEIDHCVIGIRSRVQKGARLKDVVMMGADYYEDDDVRAANLERGIEPMGVGRGCLIERAIIDKNARIGAGCVIRGAVDRPDEDGHGWYVRDGIVIVPKDVTLPEGTII